jgi:signal transduction histidine kinase
MPARAPLAALDLRGEQDVVAARQGTRAVAAALGLDVGAQTRLATAVSEVARTALRAAGAGRIEFDVEGDATAVLRVRVTEVRDARAGARVTPQPPALPDSSAEGLVAARRLADEFEVQATPAGPVVTVGKVLPRRVGRAQLTAAARAAVESGDGGALAELERQHAELLRALDESQALRHESERLAQELAETNRGVLALYAELDERAEYLERLNQLKTRFLSDLNHEIRTPLNAVRNVARLLLDGYEGALSDGQRKAIEMMRASTDALDELVNDWLDLAKIESGRTEVRVEEFTLEALFATVRAVFRPLAGSPSLELVFDDVSTLPSLVSDEAKVAQVVRNFVSNALKFTERGEVRVSATVGADDVVLISVADTGIGIAAEHQERVFEEFAQIESPLQRRVKGTGLGLPLARKLARLLGGDVSLRSTPGAGTTFTLSVPRVIEARAGAPAPAEAGEGT